MLYFININTINQSIIGLNNLYYVRWYWYVNILVHEGKKKQINLSNKINQ